jgi:hypothetical protein
LLAQDNVDCIFAGHAEKESREPSPSVQVREIMMMDDAAQAPEARNHDRDNIIDLAPATRS